MKKSKTWLILPVFVLSFVMMSFKPALEAGASAEGNDYPIVLVHGLAGWGEDEFLGYHYWGGLRDIVKNLNASGYETIQATVGPVSSNYDRAVELYYYLKGGKVDYGTAHAKEHGHDRYGRTYQGLYQEWDQENKVHLLGHSMGGQTVRTLVELLENGSEEEREHLRLNPQEGMSPLFTGDKSWVHSVTSLATPHNGSTFADQENVIPFIKDLVIKAAGAAGVLEKSIVYDFKLDQWGLKRKAGESFNSYMNRVLTSKIWESEDISAYDLSTAGAAELNEQVKTHPGVYYFSYTGNASYKGALSGNYYPISTVNPIMKGISLQMGSYKRQSPGPVIDRSWLQNDGIVNVISSKYPFGQPQQAYNGQAQQGVWNHLPIMEGWDHIDFIDILGSNTPGYWNIYQYYQEVAERLHELPN